MLTLHSIKSKILIFAILATLIPSAGLGLLSYRQNQTILADNVTHQLRTLASDTRRELEFWLNTQIDGLRALSTSDAVFNGLVRQRPSTGTDAQEAKVLSHYLRLVAEKLEPLLALTVTDANGQVIASSTDQRGSITLPDAWQQGDTTETVIIDPPHWDKTLGRATLGLAVPVLSVDDRHLGSLIARVDLSHVQSRLEDAARASPGEVTLLAADGSALLTTQGAVIGLAALDGATLQRLYQQQDQPIHFTGHAGVEVLGLALASEALHGWVVAERERQAIDQAWVVFRNLFLAFLVGLTLLVGLVGWAMGRSIVTPLQRLTRAADSIAAGDLSVQLPVERRDEIGQLTRVFNQMTGELRHSQQEVEAASLALQEQNQLLETLAVTDSLTGLYNRNKLNEILAEQFARYQRHQRPFAVLLLDIDHFKALNDTYGHLAGDQVLKNVAQTLSHSIRSVDYAARYGGEEFVIVLPETSIDTARDLAQRICSQIQSDRHRFEDQTLAVTLSIGVAAIRDNDKTVDAVVARADDMLYQAKRAGRNRVHCAI